MSPLLAHLVTDNYTGQRMNTGRDEHPYVASYCASSSRRRGYCLNRIQSGFKIPMYMYDTAAMSCCDMTHAVRGNVNRLFIGDF
jgi:hypothetical protein